MSQPRTPAKLHESVASDHLNLVRGLAALAVLAYHVRYRLFPDYADLVSPTAAQKAFYTATAFGHDAVMVFFVLSGYFISATVIRDCQAGRWSWGKYLTSRFVRLYVVLLPGLALTLFWDHLGMTFFPDNPVYTGESRPWRHDYFPVGDRLTLPVLLGNLFFLQSIWFPPLGSNAPLWSLSYEFWYYLLFPCAWLALFAKGVSRPMRALYLLLCCCGLLFIGKTVTLYFPIWLMGTGIYLLPRLRFLAARPKGLTVVATLLFCVALGLTHLHAVKELVSHSVLVIDYLTGVGFAVLLYLVVQDQSWSARGAYAALAGGLASFSYTLYVTHMPLLVLLRAALLPDQPWPPNPGPMGIAGLLSLACLGYAFVVARLTEARTDEIRAWVLDRLRPKVRLALIRLAPGQQPRPVEPPL